MARPYWSTLKYPDYKKGANLNVHVKVFQATIKMNGETFDKCVTNAFNYTMKETTSDWCHNYMLEFPNYVFFELTQTFYKCHQKTQNDEQIYMEFKNIK